MISKPIDIEEVKTTADINRLYLEQCTTKGLQVSLYTYIAGIIGIPLAFMSLKKRIPIGFEYKLAISAVSAMVLSYSAGVYTKRRCETNLKKKLQELHKIP